MSFHKDGKLVTWKCFDGQHHKCKGKWGRCECECHKPKWTPKEAIVTLDGFIIG